MLLTSLFNHEGLTYLSFSIVLLIIALVSLHAPKEYQPYKPRARWKKKIRQAINMT
jgi:hypothetical protein